MQSGSKFEMSVMTIVTFEAQISHVMMMNLVGVMHKTKEICINEGKVNFNQLWWRIFSREVLGLNPISSRIFIRTSRCAHGNIVATLLYRKPSTLQMLVTTPIVNWYLPYSG